MNPPEFRGIFASQSVSLNLSLTQLSHMFTAEKGINIIVVSKASFSGNAVCLSGNLHNAVGATIGRPLAAFSYQTVFSTETNGFLSAGEQCSPLQRRKKRNDTF